LVISPYANQPISNWLEITNDLIRRYPIALDEILDIATLAWDRLWSSRIGDDIKISEVDLPATVVGYFFQKLFAHELARRYPNIWRGELNKSDKDLVNLSHPYFSTEMKSSGQAGYSLFGNRSYNQESINASITGKDKSGYYITLNFYRQSMTLLRVGWIDQDDWIPQGSQTGQAATLHPDVYKYKLVDIKGSYILDTPIELLRGVGPAALRSLHAAGVYTFNDLKHYNGSDTKAIKLQRANLEYLQGL
jgi:hypothetical protein